MHPTHAATTADLIPVGAAAALLGVHPDTVKRWEKAGRIQSRRTPTGHRRFDRAEVLALLSADERIDAPPLQPAAAG